MNQPHKNFVILISGPTGTGKSDFVLQLGKQLPVEIVNADIGSFYTQLSIGTAKPDWKNEKTPHHFFDILDSPINYTAPQFREQLQVLIEEIWERGNIPVVVGGSAFYIQSFFYKNHELATPSEELIDSLEEQPVETLWEQLHAIDPARAAKIDRNDKYRVVRALAIWYTQGQKPSEFEQQFDPIAPFFCIMLTRDRDQLYEMINQRVELMLQAGWIDEVKALIHDQSWVDFLCKKKMIGYNELIGYLQGHFCEQDFDEIKDLIKQRTRNYAKRQMTFLKKLASNIQKDQINHPDKQIRLSHVESFNLTESDSLTLIERINKKL
ncbi:tRNA (adenosine(37)-N6)-dimethylallyltransferase MiaA [Candidatus Babeliales bacterium]|nr:tRNA (adenosine(37)-N6)-dimethylallyltransferase MiaA [Candidatus Babeliales bacterium]MBP9843931.1 tRNA (adenosine(37)-N6)-dimethylallyltransferase MiaA [Candidatus Babeliales bacterium]